MVAGAARGRCSELAVLRAFELREVGHVARPAYCTLVLDELVSADGGNVRITMRRKSAPASSNADNISTKSRFTLEAFLEPSRL
jgi:hypothetical protein